MQWCARLLKVNRILDLSDHVARHRHERGGMNSIEREIQNMVDRETRAWDALDAEGLVDIFHPDMVWPWPPTSGAHDPVDWIFPMGRFDRERWRRSWQELFDSHRLLHNRRDTVKIVVSPEEDGAFAVVDVDTLWQHRETGRNFHWKGRACKGYTKMDLGWKLIYHTGLLDYGSMQMCPEKTAGA